LNVLFNIHVVKCVILARTSSHHECIALFAVVRFRLLNELYSIKTVRGGGEFASVVKLCGVRFMEKALKIIRTHIRISSSSIRTN